MRRNVLLALCFLLGAGTAARGDEVTLRGGKKVRGFLFRGDRESRINTFGCSLPEMTLGVRRMRSIDVMDVTAYPPQDGIHRALTEIGARDVVRRVELMRTAQAARLKGEVERLAAEILRVDPTHAEAKKAIGSAKKVASIRAAHIVLQPSHFRTLRTIAREPTGKTRKQRVEALRAAGASGFTNTWFERAARAVMRPRGRRDEVRPIFRADEYASARYSFFAPEGVDPFAPRPLIVALHGGGIAHQDPKAAPRGSGKEMMVLLEDVAASQGWYLVAPHAVEAPWTTSANDAWVSSVIEEVCTKWNVDLNRIHLLGVGGGAAGARFVGQRGGPAFASIGIAAGDKPAGLKALAAKKTAIWLYHGASDTIFDVAPVRKAAERLAKTSADFVYCELPKEEHGLPPVALKDWLHFVSPKRSSRAKSAWPQSSLARKASKEELLALGPPKGAWGAAVSAEMGEEAYFKILAGGTTESEPAAGFLQGAASKAAFASRVRTLVANDKAPLLARHWGAWLLGRWNDRDALDPLTALVRRSKDPRLVIVAANALSSIAHPDASRDLVWALGDVSTRYRGVKGTRVPFHEFRLACDMASSIVSAIGKLGKNPDVAGTIEEQIVVAILRDRRPVTSRLEFAEDARVPRAKLVKSIVATYRAIGAEKTLFDMLRVAVKDDPEALRLVRPK